MNKKSRKSVLAVLLASMAIGSAAYAARLEDEAGKAVLSNPDVLAKWHQFKSSGFERDTAWGRYLPTLDALYGAGEERRSAPGLAAGATSVYSTESSKLTLRQNVFEGFATVNETKRLEHAQLVRYYELLDVSENAALEAVRAYTDVYRFRKFVELAEGNYAAHRLILGKIDERARSGVGRGVDLEFAAGRMALAESNLLTEASNLHDVNARYQRVIGELPKGEFLPPNTLRSSALPKNRNDAVAAGFQSAPQLKAAEQNILSAQRNVAVQKAGYYPRVDLYAEQARDKNLQGAIGMTNVTSVGATVTINLFRGNQDVARTRRAIEDKNVANDLREKVCRDVRQTLSIAYNDYLRLSDQLKFLDQHKLSSDKAREAFRRQFDIGQRTLLDVLNTENEFFTASRNYLNGEMDLALASARYQAAAGQLLTALNLKPLDMDPPNPDTALDADAQAICPPAAVPYPEYDKEAYFTSLKAKEDLYRSQSAQKPAVIPPPPPPATTAAPAQNMPAAPRVK